MSTVRLVMTRRRALQLGVGGAVAACDGARRPEAASPALPATETRPAEPADDALDRALKLLQDREPESRQGLSTHAPMVAEALCAMGHGDQAVAWVEREAAPTIALPRPSARIDPERWREAAGPRPGATWEAELVRWADWREFFAEALARSRWQEVLDLWAARLAPGLCAAATHGVIRTGHAVRALADRETEVRRAELARGLAYWAAAYQELPVGAAGTAAGSYAQALERVPLHWEAHGRRPAGNIVAGLRAAGALDGFAGVHGMVAATEDVGASLSSLSATFARAYLRHGARHDEIAFIHAVTGPCALRRIAPHVRPATARAAVAYAWQAAAAVYAAYARRSDDGEVPEPRLSRAELVARALENGDEHAIKFTEVLLAEHAIDPDPVYLAAAEDAVRRL